MFSRITAATAVVLSALSTGAYAMPAAAHSSVKPMSHAVSMDHYKGWRQANEETRALNALEASGYSNITHIRVKGDQVFADAKKHNMSERVVVTQNETITHLS